MKEDERTIHQFGVQPVFLCNLCDQLVIERPQSKNHLNKHKHICMLCQKFGCESLETLQEHWENVHDYTPTRTDYVVPPFFERFMVCYMTEGQINCVLLSPKEIDDLEEASAGKYVGNLLAMSLPRFMSIIDFGTEVPGLRADSEFIEHMQLTNLADVTKEEVERNPHGPSLYFKGMYSSVYKRKLDRWFMQHNMDSGEDSSESGSVYCLEGRHLVTATFPALTRHLFRHLKILPYYCSQCYFGAVTVREIITHAREKNHNPSRISVSAMELGNPLLHMIIRELYGQDTTDMLHWTDGRCIQCPHLKTLNNIEAIQAHVADSHFPMYDPYFCSDPECLFSAESVQKVKDHIQFSHSTSAKETNGPIVIRNFGKMAMAFNQMLMRCFPHSLPPISNEIVFDSLGHSELIDLECSPRFADILMGIQIFNDFWWFTKEMAAEIPPKPSSFPMIEEKGVYKTIPCHPRRYTKDFDWMKGEQGPRVHSDSVFDEYLICAWCEGMLIERRKSGSHISRTHPTVYECYICQAFKSDTHDHVRQHWMTVHGLSWEEVKGRVVRSQAFPRIYQECFADPKKRRIPVIGLTAEEFNNLESICIVHVSQETQWFLQRRLIYLPDKCRISVANKKDKAEVFQVFNCDYIK